MEKKPYVIGLDLGGTNSEFGIVDRNANIVASTRVKTAGHGDVNLPIIMGAPVTIDVRPDGATIQFDVEGEQQAICVCL